MSDIPHLYSVDADGTTTPQPPSGGGAEEGRTRAPAKARPQFPVPSDRMKFDTQVTALRTIVTASRNGTDDVDADTMAKLMNLSATTAGLNNAFYVYLGLAEKTGRGSYRPTKLAVDFSNKWTFNRDEAAKMLAPAFAKSWFLDAVRQKLDISGNTAVAEMIETLAGVAGTDDSYAAQYGFCLDWLEYVGIIDKKDGTVKLTGTDTVLNLAEQIVDATPQTPVVTPTPAVPKSTVQIERGPAVVNITLDVYATADDIAKLSAEQISALFEGVGKIAAVKAALEKN